MDAEKEILAVKERLEQLEKIIHDAVSSAAPPTTTYVPVYINGQRVNLALDGAGGGSVAGSDTEIQFNDGGDFGADPDFTWDKTNQMLRLADGTEIASAGGMNITAALGGGINIDAGDGGVGTDNGGDLVLTSGTGGTTGGVGGNLNLIAGDGNADDGGFMLLEAGDGGPVDGNGGDVEISAGDASDTYQGGSLIFDAGAGGQGGRVALRSGPSLAAGLRAGDIEARLAVTSSKPGRFIIMTNSGNQFSYRFVGQVSTADGTPATVDILDLDSLSGNAVFIEVRVAAQRTGGIAGTAEDSAGYVRRAVYKRGSGASSLVGAIQDSFTVENQAGWNCTFVLSGDTVQLQVTGAADNNVNWDYEIHYMLAGAGFVD